MSENLKDQAPAPRPAPATATSELAPPKKRKARHQEEYPPITARAFNALQSYLATVQADKPVDSAIIADLIEGLSEARTSILEAKLAVDPKDEAQVIGFKCRSGSATNFRYVDVQAFVYLIALIVFGGSLKNDRADALDNFYVEMRIRNLSQHKQVCIPIMRLIGDAVFRQDVRHRQPTASNSGAMDGHYSYRSDNLIKLSTGRPVYQGRKHAEAAALDRWDKNHGKAPFEISRDAYAEMLHALAAPIPPVKDK